MEKSTAKIPDIKEIKHKKAKKDKENDSRSAEPAAPEVGDIDVSKLIEKQQEAFNVIEQKKELLVSNQLSYLEYIEMQEEIGRLNQLRNNFQSRINALRKQRKKNEMSGSK
ncbi:uncharacterized protein LOC119659744 [Hermetia illucens]|uniref:uncharacterized protein LOC119659744 n=1 Tax=Hermetia illucens TaxID=343691 RepID=UPI0018CC583A|nr:uncharacterized protein LOC119659744 [Hermetia illucens]